MQIVCSQGLFAKPKDFIAQNLTTVVFLEAYPCLFMRGTPVVSAMPMALIGRLIASVRVDYGDTMSTEHFAVRQSRVGHLWPPIKALLEPFLIQKPK